MSTSSHVLIIALSLGMATASFEWKGIFLTPEATYTWKAQKATAQTDGTKDYADPSMKFVAIPTGGATLHELTTATTQGTSSIALTTCEDVTSGGSIVPAENKCFNLVFDSANAESTYTVDATNAGSIAFFTAHLPTEFEDTAHYFVDSTGSDIEPVFQEPEPSADGHGHAHGSADNFEANCVCQALANNWVLNCTKMAPITAAVAALDAKPACKQANPPQDCIDNFFVMQAHHDHCLHDQLPTGIENTLHDYEHFYDDCYVNRQFDPDLVACPPVVCTDQATMTQAVATLQAGCGNVSTVSGEKCHGTACAAAIKTVLAAHDLCSEAQLPNNLEVALHDHEDACEDKLCNTGDAVFDPYAQACSAPTAAPTPTTTAAGGSGDTPAASGAGSQDAILVKLTALVFAVLFSSWSC